jgi:hypothetical protein
MGEDVDITDLEANKTNRKRPDRAAKLAERKDNVETVVKSALLKTVCGDGHFKDAFIKGCKARVDAVSRRLVMASIRLSGLLKRAFDGQSDVCSVALPNVFDPTFVRQLMLGIDAANKVDPHLSTFLKDHPDGLDATVGERLQGDSNIYCYAAQRYITNMKTALKTTFKQRLLRYLKTVQRVSLPQCSDDQRTAMLFSITGWKMPKSVSDVDISDASIQAIICEQRRILKLKTKKAVIDDAWFKRKDNLLNVLRQWTVFNRWYASNAKPLFSIVPQCKVRHHFVSIDTSSLYGLLKQIDMVKGDFEAFDDLRKEHWYSVLNLKALEDKTGVRRFSFMMDTDGISVCTHWTRPKTTIVISSSCQTLDPNVDRVVAVDPGRVIIMYAVERQASGRFKAYTLTRNEYYTVSGVFEARKETERWSDGIRDALDALSKVSIKGVDIVSHEAFLTTYKDVSSMLWNEYTKSRWARQRLRLYGGKKRAFAKFFNDIKTADDQPDAKRRVVFAYGSAHVGVGGKGELSAPSSRALKECRYRFDVVLVDEYRTSKMDCDTGRLLGQVAVSTRQSTNDRRHSRPLRGLLWSDKTIDKRQSKFVGRDFNAAVNIWRCATEAVRPMALTRRPGDTKLVQRVAKVIKSCNEPAR